MRTYGPGEPLVFNHIPKTAGTSLTTALLNALRPTTVIRSTDTSLVGGYDNFDGLPAAALAQFVFSPDDLDADADLVAGHLAPGTTMTRYPDADHITMLRDPRLRVLSQWLHGRALSDFDLRHFGREGKAFRVARMPLGRYLEHAMIAPNVDNTVTRFLAWPHPLLGPTTFIGESEEEEILAAARARLDAFGWVGLVENGSAVDDLADWLGHPLPVERLNERRSIPRKRRTDLGVELDPATMELLAHRTRLDTRLWRLVAERTMSHADPDELLAGSWERSLARYRTALAEPNREPRVRRVAEIVYDAGYRLRHREPY